MPQIVVTTGYKWVDIDGLACVIAYQEIPQSPALGIIAGPLNQSVPQSVRKWLPVCPKDLKPGDYDFVITDVSEKDQFPSFVDPNRIIEIYDHHFGFEKYWQEKLGDKAKIEPVGACATLIWEELKKRKERIISPLAANLLYMAIVSNTLNFQASVTTDRDKKAFDELKNYTSLPENWIIQYYQDQEADVYFNPELAIANDTKIQVIKGTRCAFGNLELWNSKSFLQENLGRIESVLKSFTTETWLFNSPSISEGRNYIFTKSETLKNLLRNVMEVDFFGGNIGVTKKIWLRKEILKKIQ